jgi:DHA2 family multidrug resistance protein
MGLLFVPLSTITMAMISKEKMGNATSLFNLMRNLGGSTGIAAVATMLSRRTQAYINVLGRDVNPYSLQTQQALVGARSLFMSRGADAYTAMRQAYGALWGTVQIQATMVAFVEVFRILALIFIVTIPLVLLMKRIRPSRPGPEAAAH